ncbi:cobalt-zinc-cadmium resistance protein czcB [Bordetella ansorpii]|uniref:Cobalt-zinc-cadmium resistance protein czcB n=1 Tax=Bordetella ansorpii TaxID=288768 RepID=A0A157S696_9BORD|nr:efflux RND transporter periplasmic adaptor subunit [Bordetella ansorpii]SAI60001.1 cobalt-zinc-cadmium resistance protein czcB [Bordetella ansorpii]SAI65456.1 cobalt-zinc-cadmium resistance protein czcB [Bordetella ansorpii]
MTRRPPLLSSVRILVLAAALFGQPMAWAEEAGHAAEGSEAKASGPNGGVVTQDGSDAVELNVAEANGQSRLQVWVTAGGKPVKPADLTVSAVLNRPGSKPEPLKMMVEPGVVSSAGSIDEPHFFDIDVEVKWPGRTAPLRAEFHKDEGLIALTAEQIANAGIKTSEAGQGNVATSARFPGEVKFNADRTAHVVPRVAGVVQQVSAELGQAVKKGDLLATISSPTLSEMRSELEAATRRRELARTTYDREQKLWKEQVSAEQDFQQARTALQEAQIAVQNAEQKLRAIGGASRAKDRSLLEVRAPFDGIVVEKHIALGEALPDTANIFTISDLTTVWAEFLIAPKDLQQVRVGESAQVSSTAFEQTAHGKVSYIGSLLGQQTRTATARVTLDNPESAWRPGLFVSVNVVVDSADVAVAVPADAVQTVEDKPTVFIAVPGGFLPQPVTLGKTSGKEVEVISGLAPGTTYATQNTFVLKSELGKASAEHGH